jgi:hypothetical protein
MGQSYLLFKVEVQPDKVKSLFRMRESRGALEILIKGSSELELLILLVLK